MDAVDDLLDLKTIRFFGRDVSIVMQSRNGPCPLIAIVNILLLQNKIPSFSKDARYVPLAELIALVADVVISQPQRSTTNEAVASVTHSVLELLPKLSRGLDLNRRFDDATAFEFTEEITVFDSLDIPLLHEQICPMQKLSHPHMYPSMPSPSFQNGSN